MKRLDPVYTNACPNCGGPISASRLEKGLPCAKCLPKPVYGGVIEVAEELIARGTLKGYVWLYDLERRFQDFRVFFQAKTGSSLWSAQASWARRLLSMESMAIIAPTGVGKTTLLQAYASYRVVRDEWRVLYLVPTENLGRQVAERLTKLLGEEAVAYYFGSMSKKKREEALDRIRRREYKVLVVTTSFLQRRFELLSGNMFNLVIVDDVDSLLRSSKNVDRVLILLGYPEEAIEIALSIVRMKLKLYAALASGLEEKAEDARREIALLESRLRGLTPELPGQLVIASATGRPRGIKHLLFKELLGFEVGGGTDYMRNVADAYLVTDTPVEDLLRIVEKLGDGGIIFVSQLYGKAMAKAVYEKLNRAGIKAELALAGSRRSIEKLATGKVSVLVGVASRYGVVVRGVDLPERVRYAVFLGVPAREIGFWDAVSSPKRLLSILYYMADHGVEEASKFIDKMRRLLDKIPDQLIVSAAFKGRIKPEGLLEDLVSTMREAASLAYSWLHGQVEDGGTLRVGGIVIERRGDDLLIVIPDAPTYLQASGRTSRLYKGTMTFGLSIILDRYKDRVDALWERLAWYTSSRPIDYRELDLDEVLEKIEESRRGKGKKVTVKSTLLIVESPTKAKTIAWFWGRPSKRRKGRLTIYETSATDEETGVVYLLTIVATKGHLYDLTIDDEGEYGVVYKDGKVAPIYAPVKRCMDCGYQYAGKGPCPRCGSHNVRDATRTVAILRKLATEVDEIVVATDPDREGEKIAWDVYLLLKPYNANIRRGRFHEVTREAILQALREAGEIDENLVAAQIARRVEDRWIGFRLSSHLWAVFGKRWLGAGRVQTPVLGWIVDRYKEYQENKGYRVRVTLADNGRLYFFTEDKETALKAKKAGHVLVKDAKYWEEERVPPPPFTTDSLIYEASRRYGYPAWLTMKLAQDLFESGLITYHRTDSTRISKAGMAIAAAYLEKKGMKHLYKPRPWGEGGAHEAIRPTRPIDVEEVERMLAQGLLRVPIKLKRAHLKLYKLIFERFIASQMKPSTAVRVSAKLALEGVEEISEEIEGIVAFKGEGFHQVYKPRLLEWALGLVKGQKLAITEITVKRASKTVLYKSGDIVRLMKERGIGRPSTYAKAIEANKRHGYVIESKKRAYLIPTKTGITVYKYLSRNFAEIVSEETSRRMEEELEKIEKGERDPLEYLEEVSQLITSLMESAPATGESVTA